MTAIAYHTNISAEIRPLIPIVNERHISRMLKQIWNQADFSPYECQSDLEGAVKLPGGYEFEVWCSYYVQTTEERGGSYENHDFERIPHIIHSRFTIEEVICRDRKGEVVNLYNFDRDLFERKLNNE